MDFNNKAFADDYYNVILNTLFSRIQLKKLMRYMKKSIEQDTILYYSIKSNFLFYKRKIDRFHSEYFDVENKTIFRNEVYEIMIQDSIEVPIYNHTEITDEDLFEKALIFCKEHNIKYYDDTDILEYFNIKDKYETRDKYVEPKDFETIEEIIEYIKNYRSAKYELPTPNYYIEKNRIIHFAGGLKYDNRILKIPKFLKENNYINEKYYNKENYPEFFEENWTTWNFDELDFKRISYLILRTFNIERINEGSVDNLISTGVLLKLLTRLK